ncbi:MAG: glutamate mutase L [Holophagaceae bacterium]|nr:glutamate mutase L [Holophagaceae bacterium]
MIFLSIDIGSTYTKGAVFKLAGNGLEFLDRAVCPTDTANLKNGFDWVRKELDPKKIAERTVFTSSAKGGLAISALGLVPDLTLKAAKSAALSAGGKVVSVHAYKLTANQISDLSKQRPDILLLAGGTDGGNEAYVRHNAEMLCQMSVAFGPDSLPALVYAGNSAIKDEVCCMLKKAGFDVHPAPNLLPNIDTMEPEGAREQIRNVFLSKIVHGKGLNAITDEIGSEPMPTPLAVLTLVEAMYHEIADFGDFVLVDMGGATTDVYSAGGTVDADARVILRGLPEPKVKRTVEGDLGMRVSASTATQSAWDTLAQLLENNEREAFLAFISHLAFAPDYLPTDTAGAKFDRILAATCVHDAMRRHAGTWRRAFTAEGETFIQQGKDLRRISKVIGTGGFLSAMSDFVPPTLEAGQNTETISLTPRSYNYLRDRNYLLPLLGAIALQYPKQAALCAIANLEPGPFCRMNN